MISLAKRYFLFLKFWLHNSAPNSNLYKKDGKSSHSKIYFYKSLQLLVE